MEPSRLSFEDQIGLFRGAQCIVGVCGSAMANIVFCQPKCSVVSLVPAQFPDTFCWFNAIHAGLHYMEIRGDQQSYDRAAAWTSGFTIREQDIQFLERLGPNTVADLGQLIGRDADVAVVHVQDTGDLKGIAGAWAGLPGSRRWIEAVIINPPAGIAAHDVIYRVVKHDGAESDWIEGTRLAGTRGQMQPLLGFQLQLLGHAADNYRCSYEATFIDGSRSGPHVDGEMIVAMTRLAPLEALRVEIRLRSRSPASFAAAVNSTLQGEKL